MESKFQETVNFNFAALNVSAQLIQMNEPENETSVEQANFSKSKRKRMRKQEKKAKEREEREKEEEEHRMDWQSVDVDIDEVAGTTEKKKKKKKKSTVSAPAPNSTSVPVQATPMVFPVFFNAPARVDVGAVAQRPTYSGYIPNPIPVVQSVPSIGPVMTPGPAPVAQKLVSPGPVFFNTPLPVNVGGVSSKTKYSGHVNSSSSVDPLFVQPDFSPDMPSGSAQEFPSSVSPPGHVSEPTPVVPPSSSIDPVQDEPQTFTPLVSWKARPLQNVWYRGCAIFDTCSLIKNPFMLEHVIEQQILAVIPWNVLTEADGLKQCRPQLRRAIKTFLNTINNRRCRQIETYLRMESTPELNIDVPEFREIRNAKNDDIILKCAIRTKAELLSLRWQLGFNESRIIFVTDDDILQGKARSHDVRAMGWQDFLEVVHAPEINPEPERSPVVFKSKIPVVQKSFQQTNRYTPIPRSMTAKPSSFQQTMKSSTIAPSASVKFSTPKHICPVPTTHANSQSSKQASVLPVELSSYEDFMSD